MKAFMDKDFLLSTDTAKSLYNDYAAKMPVIDYHCHINPQEIFENRRFENITQVWLGGDHYKWRVMRSCGVEEQYITGNASDKDKFFKFAECLPRAIGNPMYHWCHLELRKYFGYQGVLNPSTAQEVWDLCNDKLQNDDNLTVRGLIYSSNVVAIGTTDDPIDTLEWHKKIAADDTCKVKVVPSYRPDKAMNIEKAGFVEYMAQLSECTGITFNTIEDVRKALVSTIDKFVANGCKASDHGLDYVIYNTADDDTLTAILKKGLAGQAVTHDEMEKYKTALMLCVAKEYAKNDVVMQLHYGTVRNTNSKMFAQLGADTGFDAINNTSCAEGIIGFLNALNVEDKLPKTIIYSLNPTDNEVIGTILGCFQGPEAKGKIQQGSGWWFNDTKTGMIAQMTSLANLGILGNFVGMLTDSRSFLSYTRHDYFRRILCQLFGGWIENGEYPADMEFVGGMVEDICYNNSQKYFGL